MADAVRYIGTYRHGEIVIIAKCDVCQRDEGALFELQQQKEKHARMDRHWRNICPPRYDVECLDHPKTDRRLAISAVAYLPSQFRAFVGPPHIGKTTAAFFALKSAHKGESSTFAVSHDRLANAGSDAESFGLGRSEARVIIDRALKADVLLLDDLGKGRFSKAANAAVLRVIEERTANGKGMIVTMQAGPSWLEEKFGPDDGPAIVARIKNRFQMIVAE